MVPLEYLMKLRLVLLLFIYYYPSSRFTYFSLVEALPSRPRSRLLRALLFYGRVRVSKLIDEHVPGEESEASFVSGPYPALALLLLRHGPGKGAAGRRAR